MGVSRYGGVGGGMPTDGSELKLRQKSGKQRIEQDVRRRGLACVIRAMGVRRGKEDCKQKVAAGAAVTDGNEQPRNLGQCWRRSAGGWPANLARLAPCQPRMAGQGGRPLAACPAKPLLHSRQRAGTECRCPLFRLVPACPLRFPQHNAVHPSPGSCLSGGSFPPGNHQTLAASLVMATFSKALCRRNGDDDNN